MPTRKLLFLTLHTFSFTGGIEKVCRALSKVFSDGVQDKKIDYNQLSVLSLCDDCDDVDTNYCRKKSFKGYNYSKTKFGVMATWHALTSSTIVLSHINLLPLAMLVKRLFPSKKIVLLAHGIEVWRNIRPWKTSFLKKDVEIWAVSHFTADILRKKHKIDDQQIKILNNCLDPFFEAPAHFNKPNYLLNQYGLTKDRVVIMTLSRLSSSELYKGYDLVIDAIPSLLAAIPSLVYVLAGKADQSEKQRLEKLIAQRQLSEHVFLTGYIPDHQLIDHLLLADVFVMPSKKEGFGIVFIEAAACGCAVIAGNADGSRDALLNGKLGQLIDPESVTELTAAVQHALCHRDKQQQFALQQTCLTHFSYLNYEQKVIQLLSAKTLQHNGK